jgi:hypothetical protein
MADSINPAATHHLPLFIAAPGQTDILMVIMAVVLALAILGFGILFLRLHTLPERIAHRSQKLQFEIVAVLGLIALFTHMHIFWIAGLLLALVEFPDFGAILGRIAGSVEKIAGVKPPESATDKSTAAKAETHDGPTKDAKPAAIAPEIAHESRRERSHA